MGHVKNITIHKVKIWKDERGVLKFFNTFNFKGVKRFYETRNSTANPIRAFHGHLKEEKIVYPVSGKTLLCIVKINNVKNPSRKAKVRKFILSDNNPKLVHIPAGFANGFKSLTKNSKVIFFSTLTLNESLKDDYRFPYDYWGKEVWKI